MRAAGGRSRLIGGQRLFGCDQHGKKRDHPARHPRPPNHQWLSSMPLHAGTTVNETSGDAAFLRPHAVRSTGAGVGNAVKSPPGGSQVVKACSRSAIKSSLSSIPIDNRTVSGPAPALTLAASSSWLCVVEAG